MEKIAAAADVPIHHIKPHGALYNMAARDKGLAPFVALAILDTNSKYLLYGLSGSYLVKEGKNLGLKTVNEVFADRTYKDDGSLTSRSKPGALIENTDTGHCTSIANGKRRNGNIHNWKKSSNRCGNNLHTW